MGGLTRSRPVNDVFPRSIIGAWVVIAVSGVGCDGPPPPALALPTPLTERVFDGPGSQLAARVSADGRRVAFQANPDGHWDLFHGAIDGSDVRRVTSWDTDESRPAWSPHGSRLVFASNREGSWDLWTIRTDGTDPVRLTSDPGIETAPDWSPDGRIVYGANNAGSWDVWVTREGETPVRLTDHEGNEWHPRWAADGRRIVFYPTWSGWTDVWVLDPLTGDLRELLGSTHEDHFPAWSADDRWIFFGSDRARAMETSGNADLWAVPSAGGEPVRVTRDLGGFRHVSVSPDGTTMFVSRRQADTDIYVVPTEGGPPTRMTSSPAREMSPQFTHGGDSVIFASDAGTAAVHLFVMSVSGGSPRQLTRGRLGHGWPSVSPDGSSIAFSAGGGDYASYDAMVMPTGGGPARPITTLGNVTNLAWCGRSSLVFMHGSISYSDVSSLWTVDVTGGEPVEVTDAAVADGALSCDPEGTAVLIAREQDDGTDLYRQPLTGGAASRLTSHPGSDVDGAWSPDGTRIAFASDRSGSFEIWVMPARGGSPVQLTHTGGTARGPRWSPDGNRIVFEVRTNHESLWRLDGAAITRALEREKR